MEVTVTFRVEDVMDELDLSEEEADEFLDANGKYIREAMTRAGFDAIHDLS
jgi:hypothetical protein